MKILITGCCGFAGSALSRALQERISGLEIVGMDNLSRPGSETNRRVMAESGGNLIHGDVRCASDFENLPQVDWVIDAAANPSVLAGVDGKSSSRQVVEHNLGGTINLLEYCRRTGAGFLLISTSRVYSISPLTALPLTKAGLRFQPDTGAGLPSGLNPKGVTEAFPAEPPQSLYGATKKASEALALEDGAAFGFPVWINRCGVLAGAGQFGTAEQGIFSYWIHTWRAKRPLRYIGFQGTGFQVRDVLHPDDLATLAVEQLRTLPDGRPQIVNAGGGLANSMSLAELSAWCANRLGEHSVEADAPPRPFDLPWLVMDSSAAEAIWTWKPARSLDQILEEIAAHAEQNPRWLELSNA